MVNILSVYSNLVNVKVKKGDKVETKQIVGDIFLDPADENQLYPEIYDI